MKKFAFIGAGSLQFTSSCVCDLLTFPAFAECEFALMDTNKQNLDAITRVVEKIVHTFGCDGKCRITPTMDRAAALKGGLTQCFARCSTETWISGNTRY